MAVPHLQCLRCVACDRTFISFSSSFNCLPMTPAPPSPSSSPPLAERLHVDILLALRADLELLVVRVDLVAADLELTDHGALVPVGLHIAGTHVSELAVHILRESAELHHGRRITDRPHRPTL
eukprot:1210601-Heterocapsa_arctica.AAC.1